MKKCVMFDVDATLVLTDRAGVYAMNSAGRQVFGDQFNFDGVSFAGSLDTQIVLDAAEQFRIELEDGQLEKFRDAYLAELERELSDRAEHVHALAGVQDLLGQLRAMPEITVGLLTGNFERGARLKLGVAGIDFDQFELGAFAEHGKTRPEVAAEALDQWKATDAPGAADPSNIIVVGDTPKDVDCAKANGYACLAVATGQYNREELLASGADAAVENLEDTQPLWQMLGTSPNVS